MHCARDALRQRWPRMWPDCYALGNSGLEVKWRIGTREKDMCVISKERSLSSRHRWGPCGCPLGNTPSRGIGKGIGTNWSKGKRPKQMKILKEMGIPDHVTWLLRNLYAGQKATVRTGHGTTDWFQIRKGVRQGYILSLCLFNLYAEYIMRNTGWMKYKLESRLLREISITSDMQMTPPLWQKVKKN